MGKKSRRGRVHSTHRKSRHKREETRVIKDKNYYIKWISVQFILYTFIIFLLEKIVMKAEWNLMPVPQALLLGFISLILTRVVYSSMHRSNFSFKGIFFWGIVYSAVFGLLLFVIELLEIGNSWANLLILSGAFTLVITFVRRMKVKPNKSRGKRKSRLLGMNSQIFTGLFLIFLSIMFFRFSHVIWLQWFNWAEGMAWSWLLGIVCLIGGGLTLIAWWRNNVSMFTTKHSVKWN